MNPPTVDELIAEIERLSRRPDDEGRTAKEWAIELGKRPSTTEQLLTFAHEQGRLRTGRRQVQYRDGRMGYVPVYAFVAPAKNGNGKR